HDAIMTAIEDELFYQKGQELKIKMSPEIIQNEIQQIRNKFSSARMFISALAFQNLTINRLAEKIEKSLIQEEVIRREIAPKVDVKDSDVEAYYNKHKKSFVEPEKYRVSHIFVSAINPKVQGKAEDPKDQEKADHIIEAVNRQAREKIDGLLKKLEEGADFADLARQTSEDDASKDKGGDLGNLSLGETLPALAVAIAGLKTGQFSGVVRSSAGFHILKLTGVIPPKQISLEKVKSDILNILLQKEIQKQRGMYLAQLKKNSKIKIFL
ncbi:MAG: peptidylprolyl isomerase, partial [Nitrospinales bacterium]